MIATTRATRDKVAAIIRGGWQRIGHEVWWVAHVAPRLRFCRRRSCLRVLAAYPLVRPTLCRKHADEHWLAATEHIRNCSHERTRPNVEAGDNPRLRDPRVCLDCGVGIVTWEAKL